MWCKHCRQDVPAVAAQVDVADGCAPGKAGALLNAPHIAVQYACVRCGETIGSEPTPTLLEAVTDLGIELADLPAGPASSHFPSTRTDGSPMQPSSRKIDHSTWQWELDQELHDVRRLIDRRGGQTLDELISHERHDPPAAIPAAPAVVRPTMVAPTIAAATIAEPTPSPIEIAPARPTASAFSWLVLMLGLTTTICGGVLLGWSMMGGRNELWTMGVPITLGGQAGLFLALVLMLLRVGKQSQESAARLHEVVVRTTSSEPAATETAAWPAVPHQMFYTHLAEGAQPQMLLADLKNQLDLLAIRMTHRQR
ncbi:MAG: hypothetical protein K8T25_24590 [Planctomycetia bacterium]|nr:hypothetical protein [Planctomycetia bacterium]